MHPIDEIIRTRRKTIALVIQPDGRLVVRAPKRATLKQIYAMVKQHTNWIAKKQKQAQETYVASTPREFVAGEEFLFLGQSYRLEIVEAEKPVLQLNGNFQLAESALPQAAQFFEKWYRQQARGVFTERVQTYAGEYGFEYGKLRLSSARMRWGSCSSKGTISLTWRLIMVPLEIVDYVVVHELTHLRENNHSKAFWSAVAAIMPDYKERRKWLKENGHRFHWP